MSVRVLVVEDHRLFAEVMADLLKEEEGVTVVGIATSGGEAIATARRECPDIVVIDLGLGDMDGFTAGRAILADRPSTKIVALTARRDRTALAEANAAGFHSYVTKDVPLPKFVRILRGVLGGGGANEPVVPGLPDRGTTDARFALRQLSPRERDVLDLLREGLGTDAVADRLGVSRNTVRSHIQRILTKLQVRSRLEAVALIERSPLRLSRPGMSATNGQTGSAARHA
jgi:DNA-binding NarL/FixJ family response regulator